MKTAPNREGEASLAEPPLPELFEDDDELEMIDGGEYDDDDDDTHNESAGASLIQTTSGATTTTVGGQQRSGEFSVIQSSPCTEQAPYRGGGHASPIPRLLPAVRRVSPPPAPLPLSTAPFDDSNVVTPDAPEAPELRSAAATTPSSPTAESASSTTFVDRIGAYFGYNGTDGNVPKPAYDAMHQRVRTLEDALGTANREVRSNSKTIAEQQSTIHALQQQLAHHEEVVRRTAELEAQLVERERELNIREQALETIARHQRRLHTRKASGNSSSTNSGIEDVSNSYNQHDGVGQPSGHQLYQHQQIIPHGPSPSSHLRAVQDAEAREGLTLLNPSNGLYRRRGSNDQSSSLVRREEEAYMQWMSPSAHSTPIRANHGPGLEALLDNARRSGLLPRLGSTVSGQPGAARSQSSLS